EALKEVCPSTSGFLLFELDHGSSAELSLSVFCEHNTSSGGHGTEAYEWGVDHGVDLSDAGLLPRTLHESCLVKLRRATRDRRQELGIEDPPGLYTEGQNFSHFVPIGSSGVRPY